MGSWVDWHNNLWVNVPVRRLRELVDPYECPPWDDCEPFTVDDVLDATANDCTAPDPFQPDAPGPYCTNWHIARVAWFVRHPHAVTVAFPESVELPHLDVTDILNWSLCAGNHRFAAAIALDAPVMPIVVSGFIDDAEELLGVAITDEPWGLTA